MNKVDGDNVYVVCDDCTYVDGINDVYLNFYTNKKTTISNFSQFCIQALDYFDIDNDYIKSQNKTCKTIFKEVLKEKELETKNVYDDTLYLERYGENEFGVADDENKEFIFYEKVKCVD